MPKYRIEINTVDFVIHYVFCGDGIRIFITLFVVSSVIVYSVHKWCHYYTVVSSVIVYSVYRYGHYSSSR